MSFKSWKRVHFAPRKHEFAKGEQLFYLHGCVERAIALEPHAVSWMWGHRAVTILVAWLQDCPVQSLLGFNCGRAKGIDFCENKN